MPENRDVQALLVRLPRSLHKQAKIQSIQAGQPLAEIVEQLLKDWLEREKQKEALKPN